MEPPHDYSVIKSQRQFTGVLARYMYVSRIAILESTVKSVLIVHPRDQKLVAVKDRWPFMTDCFTAEGQKQNIRITQMAVKGR
jgi:hypothetical protein